jgi:hypothetical protein
MKSARAGCDILKRLSRLRLMMPEHCTKEVGIAVDGRSFSSPGGTLSH